MTWTPDLVAQLKVLWEQGESTAEIGRRLGISKNAVVGKAHRLALQARPSPIRRRRVAAKPMIKGPRCQWPIGDPRSAEFRFCEEEAAPGKPYCDGHCQMAYTRSGGSASERRGSGAATGAATKAA